MKQLLLLSFLLFFALGAQAQASLRVEENSSESIFEAQRLDDHWAEFTAQRHVTNTSGKSLNLRWELEVADAPAAWEYRVCDKNASYAIDPDLAGAGLSSQFASPVVLGPGETAIFDLDVLPRQAAGCGEVNLHFYDAANPGRVLSTAAFHACVNADGSVSAAAETAGRNNLRIFPNPATDYIELPKNALVKQLWVSNILGKRVKTIPATFNGRYDISELPDGIYLVSLVDSKRSVLKTVRVSKRNPRP